MKLEVSNFDELSTSDKVSYFLSHFRKFKRTRQNSEFFDSLLKSLMCDTYSLPANVRWIRVSEISGFLLYIMDSFESLLNNYSSRNHHSNWDAYFKSYMLNRFKNYKRKLILQKKKETAILSSQISYEYREKTLENTDSIFVAEEEKRNDATPIQRFIYILQRSKKTRCRFFVFLISCSPSLTDELLAKICRTFAIDLGQTKELIKRLSIPDFRERILERQEKLSHRRDYNFSQILFYEYNYNQWSHSHHREDQDLMDLEDRCEINKIRQEERNSELTRITVKIGEQQLSDLLNIQRGTISSGLYSIRELLSWCLNQGEINFEIIPKKIAVDFEDGTWKSNLKKNSGLDLFKPFEVFNIKS